MVAHADVVVAGGGPVGAVAALAMAQAGIDVLVVEPRRDAPDDPRAIALSYASRLVLERLGAFPDGATAIETIHVSQKGGLGRVVMSAAEAGVPALGHVARYGALGGALGSALDASPVRVERGRRVTGARGAGAYAVVDCDDGEAITCRLAVIADGGHGSAFEQRRRPYGQVALAATARTDRPHGARAYERFTSHGPMALLPLGESWALIWVCTPAEAEEVAALPEPEFLARLSERFGGRAGRFIAAGPRSAFPLSLAWAPEVTGPRLVAVGNAAQQLHPIAGQGFNLGLRDAWTLAHIAAAVPRDALGDQAMLGRYRAARRADRVSGIATTDFLVRAFGIDLPLAARARGAGLAALAALPALRRAFARHMVFGAHT